MQEECGGSGKRSKEVRVSLQRALSVCGQSMASESWQAGKHGASDGWRSTSRPRVRVYEGESITTRTSTHRLGRRRLAETLECGKDV